MTGDDLTAREQLACKLAMQVKLLTSIDARRQHTGVQAIGLGTERAVVDESLRAIEHDTAKDEAAKAQAALIVFAPRRDWYEKYFSRKAA